jgi:hypothetical protein
VFETVDIGGMFAHEIARPSDRQLAAATCNVPQLVTVLRIWGFSSGHSPQLASLLTADFAERNGRAAVSDMPLCLCVAAPVCAS